jgi:AcrR family transcriptional regulator
MPRPRDPKVDEAIVTATLALLGERGFGAMTVEAVADRAGVGKPAIYRRFADKAALVETVIRWQLPELEVPDRGDTRGELWEAVRKGLPADGAGYLRLIGGLVAEEEQHPELIAAFRENLMAPRRALVASLIERGKERGEIAAAVDPVMALDAMAGSYLARAFAGLDVGKAWRRRAFENWWQTIKARSDDD